MNSSDACLSGSEDGMNSGDSQLPWLEGPSIYNHICQHIDPQTGRLSAAGTQLPDEEDHYMGSKLRFVAGFLDGTGILMQPVTAEEAAAHAHQAAGLLVEIALHDSMQAKLSLYDLVKRDDLVVYIDEVLQELVAYPSLPADPVHEFALVLAQNSRERGAVKFAISLLGLIAQPQDVDLITRLAIHEELTLYSVAALVNMLSDPEQELWALAKKLDGWGRIHAVERLVNACSPEIKEWLLLEGYRNRVMYEDLAYDCAVGGGLRDALMAPAVDGALLLAAGELIAALLNGGPAKNINDYADAADVLLRYLQLMQAGAREVQHYLAIDSILGYLSEDWDSDAKSACGWDDDRRDSAIVLANNILEKPYWWNVVKNALNSQDAHEFYDALRAADLIGMDTWDLRWSRLEQQPLNGGRWFQVMQKADSRRIDQIISLAIKELPLEQLASGPAEELGGGEGYQRHQCLGFVVQDLYRFPGKGWPLMAASLKAPVIWIRNMALKALEAWGQENWPDGAEHALQEALEIEPVVEVKERIGKLLLNGAAPS